MHGLSFKKKLQIPKLKNMSSQNIGSDGNLGLGFEKINVPPLQEDRTTKKAQFRAEGTDVDNPHKPS